MRRAVIVFATLALLGTSLLAPGAATAGAACGGSARREEYKFKTFHIEYDIGKKLYAVGQTVSVDVNVTRPAKEDPLDEGIPLPIERPVTEPVEDAVVGVGFQIGRVYLPGGSMTDEEGNATVAIKIESYTPRNTWADASIYAFKTLLEIPCYKFVEYGHALVPRAFRTAP
jgi:hypothetical protein